MASAWTRQRWSWRLAVGLVVIAALAQACGGSSSNSTGASRGSRIELRFPQVTTARFGALPQGCQSVEITTQPENKTVSASDTTVSLLLPAGRHSASGILHCGGQSFPSDKPDPVFTVPPGLQSIDVALIFGGVNVTLTVQVSGGIQVTGDGIACPGDCSQAFFTGTSVTLTASQPDAIFSGGCSGTGSCTVVMNTDKTVFVGVGGGVIRVTNTGAENSGIVIRIDGSIVDPDLDPRQSVSRSVAPGNHEVRAFCNFGEVFPQLESSPQNVSVSGGTVQVNFDGDECFQIGLKPRR
jgi:hypothetical protein